MRYHPYGNIDPFRAPEAADKVLTEYWDIAESMKIKTFLYYGTCLGIVRDGGYIIGDNDIDVGILGDRIGELATMLIKSGFEKKRQHKRNWHFFKYDILLDIYFGIRNLRFLQPLGEVTYKGRVYTVPHPVGGYLEGLYGDWKIKNPRREWKGTT